MASVAAAYPNSGDSGSAKERHFFSRAEIEEFFESCPAELLSRRFRHFLRGVWIAAGRPFGGDIQVFKAVKNYKDACYYRSESTVRYNLRASEKLGLLEVVHRDDRGQCHHIWIRPRTERDRGLYRRVTTHRLPISLLVKWREAHRRGEQVTPIRKPAQPTPPPLPPAPAAPAPARKAAEHRSNQRGPAGRRITRDERLVLFTAYIALKKSGKTHEAALDEVARQYEKHFARADVELAIQVIATKKTEHGKDWDARDYRKLMQELNVIRENVGSGRTPEQNFAIACRQAGLSVTRGLELWERMNEPPPVE